jgi:hypothetical protein
MPLCIVEGLYDIAQPAIVHDHVSVPTPIAPAHPFEFAIVYRVAIVVVVTSHLCYSWHGTH